jgi:hypothetical protein
MKSAPRLRAAVHWRVNPPFASDAPSLEEKIALLGRIVGAQVNSTLCSSRSKAQDLIVSSTVLSTAVCAEPVNTRIFYDNVLAECGRRPLAMLHAYMCTGWGFALRFLATHAEAREVVAVIADVDLHNLQWHRRHPVIGASGFGISTLVFSLPPGEIDLPTCAGPYPNSAFNEFIRAVKAQHAQHGRCPTFIPFLQQALAKTAERAIGKDTLGPNRNEEYGHCFGSDPWIGIIEWLNGQALQQPRTVCAGAIAYNGYYTLGRIDVSPETVGMFQAIEGDKGALLRTVELARRSAARVSLGSGAASGRETLCVQ